MVELVKTLFAVSVACLGAVITWLAVLAIMMEPEPCKCDTKNVTLKYNDR